MDDYEFVHFDVFDDLFDFIVHFDVFDDLFEHFDVFVYFDFKFNVINNYCLVCGRGVSLSIL